MTWHHPLIFVKSCDLVSILQAVLYFKNQHLAPFYRLFCKITNLKYIDLQFSVIISDVNIDNLAKFCYHVQKLHFQKIGCFCVFGLCWPMINRPDQLCQNFFLILGLPIELNIWYKFHGHTLSSFQDLRVGWPANLFQIPVHPSI